MLSRISALLEGMFSSRRAFTVAWGAPQEAGIVALKARFTSKQACLDQESRRLKRAFSACIGPAGSGRCPSSKVNAPWRKQIEWKRCFSATLNPRTIGG